MGKLKEIMFLIMEGKPLPGHCREHMLAGPWKGVMDAHVEPDWLLLYTRGDGFVRFERTAAMRICLHCEYAPPTRTRPQCCDAVLTHETLLLARVDIIANLGHRRPHAAV